jgi:hypothetical protein
VIARDQWRELPARSICAARQLNDEDGPAMPPYVLDGHNSDLPSADRALRYNASLEESDASENGGGHCAKECHHFYLPTTCCVVDPVSLQLWTSLLSLRIHAT